jgi:hypothetical protein
MMPILKKPARKIQQPGIGAHCLLPFAGAIGALSSGIGGIGGINAAGAATEEASVADASRTSDLARGTPLANRSRT